MRFDSPLQLFHEVTTSLEKLSHVLFGSKLLIDSIIYTIGAIIPQAVGFILMPVITKYLPPDEYGIVSSMNAFAGILIVFLTLVLEGSIFRLYYDYKTLEEKMRFLSTISISLFTISTSIVVLLLILHNYVSLIFKSIPFSPYYLFTILAAYFSVFGFVPLTYYRVIEQARTYFLLSIGLFFLETFLTLCFVVGFKWGAAGRLGAHMVANLSFALLYVYLLRKIITMRLNFDFQILKDALHYSLPLVPTSLSGWILNFSDRIFIERYFTLADVGIYSLGYQIGMVVMIITGGIHTAYTPFFYKLANTRDQKSAKEQLYRTNTVYILAVCLMCFLISLFSKEVVSLMAHHSYLEAYKIVPLIALAYLFNQVTGILNLYIGQEKRTKALMYLTLCGAGINILLNFLLVPKYRAYGAAYATIISFAIVFLAKYLYSKRCYFIPWAWDKILPYAFGLFGVVILFWFINLQYISLSLIMKVLVALLIVCFFSKQYRIVNFRKIFESIKGFNARFSRGGF